MMQEHLLENSVSGGVDSGQFGSNTGPLHPSQHPMEHLNGGGMGSHARILSPPPNALVDHPPNSWPMEGNPAPPNGMENTAAFIMDSQGNSVNNGGGRGPGGESPATSMSGPPEVSSSVSEATLLGGPGSETVGGPGGPGGGGPNGANAKKSSSRRNAWGNMSYADLITQAIQSTPEKRLTLSQVYEWMVQNIPYFKDKGDSNSSAGWKNSIRHNLSLHSRFVRVQNEGTGKSSWWMLNPDAKTSGGKSSRRRTPSMDSANRGPEFKRRGRSKKSSLTNINRNGVGTRPGVSPIRGPPGMTDIYPDAPNFHQFPFPPDLRGRGNLEFQGGSGHPHGGVGRISPNLRNGVMEGQYGYPGAQEWGPEYPQCGGQGYYPGSMPRDPYCDPLSGNGGPEEFSGPRAISPIHLPHRSNGFPFRGAYPGNPNEFHAYHGGPDIKMPSSPLVSSANQHGLGQDGNSYTNSQVMSPMTGNTNVQGDMSPSPRSAGAGSGSRLPNNANFPSPESHHGPATPGGPGDQPPLLSPHPKGGHTFFPPCSMNPRSAQSLLNPPPSQTSPRSNSTGSNSSILERALATTIKQEDGNPVSPGGTHLEHTHHPNPQGNFPWPQMGSNSFADVNVEDYIKHDMSNAMEGLEYMGQTGPEHGPQGINVGYNANGTNIPEAHHPLHHNHHHMGQHHPHHHGHEDLRDNSVPPPPASQYQAMTQPPWVRNPSWSSGLGNSRQNVKKPLHPSLPPLVPLQE